MRGPRRAIEIHSDGPCVTRRRGHHMTNGHPDTGRGNQTPDANEDCADSHNDALRCSTMPVPTPGLSKSGLPECCRSYRLNGLSRAADRRTAAAKMARPRGQELPALGASWLFHCHDPGGSSTSSNPIRADSSVSC
jgi:hypothetical protein